MKIMQKVTIVSLLALGLLSGCGTYEPAKVSDSGGATLRSLDQVGADMVTSSEDWAKLVEDVANAAPGDQDRLASETSPKVTEVVRRIEYLMVESARASKTIPPVEQAKIMAEYNTKAFAAATRMKTAMTALAKNPNPTKNVGIFIQHLKELGEEVLESAATAKQKAEAPPEKTDSPLPAPDPPGGAGWIISIFLLLIVAACAGVLFSDGIWGNFIRLVNVVFAGLLAMSFYEPVAKRAAGWQPEYTVLFDFLAIWAVFAVAMVVFREITDNISKVQVKFPKIIDQIGGAILGIWIGWVLAGFTLTTMHMAPLPRTYLGGGFQPNENMFFGILAPDREWLGFTRRMSQGAFAGDKEFDPQTQFIAKEYEMRKNVEGYITHLPEDQRSVLINEKFAKGAKPATPPPPKG